MAGTRESVTRTWAKRHGMTWESYQGHISAGEKWCTSGKHWRPRTDFGIDRARSDGLHASCIACREKPRKRSGPSLTERRAQRLQGLAWCSGCEAWLAADEVLQGKSRTHRRAAERLRYATQERVRMERRQHAHARKRGVAPVPPEGAEIILEDFAGCCAYCGDPATTWDHIIPISRGGRTVPHNIVPACVSCNSSKRERDLFEWAQATGHIISQQVLDRMDLAFVSPS